MDVSDRLDSTGSVPLQSRMLLLRDMTMYGSTLNAASHTTSSSMVLVAEDRLDTLECPPLPVQCLSWRAP